MSFTLPEQTAFLLAAENESSLFSQKLSSSSFACNSHLQKTTQLQQGSLPSLIPTRMWWHTLTPTICWNTSSSTQHSGVSRRAAQSNRWGWVSLKELEAETRTETVALRTLSKVTWDFGREKGGYKVEVGGAGRKVEGVDCSGGQLCYFSQLLVFPRDHWDPHSRMHRSRTATVFYCRSIEGNLLWETLS